MMLLLLWLAAVEIGVPSSAFVSDVPAFDLRLVYPLGLSGNCKKLLDVFSQASYNYTTCLFAYSLPVTFCQNCLQHFDDLKRAYKNIDGEKDKTCRDAILKGDLVGIVDEVHHFGLHLWDKGQCEKCYTVNGSLSEKSATFLRHLRALNKCFFGNVSDTPDDDGDTSNKSVICNKCHADYRNLVDFYSDSFGYDPSKVCADISNQMNSTFHVWSKVLQCPGVNKQLPVIIGMCCAFLTLPLFFYTGTYFCHVKQQKKAQRKSEESKVSHIQKNSQDWSEQSSSFN
eukprot:m.2078 g.2078  ORF g.2078 m.2078 type:complete len:285 (+) comp8269_c0_seq1:82-936(+)